MCDTPQGAADYWHTNIPENPYYNPECECFVVLILNCRRRVTASNVQRSRQSVNPPYFDRPSSKR
jgi:hypothetical protein